MGSGRLKRLDDFLLAAYDQLGDVCLTHNVKVAIDMVSTTRRGVFTVRLRAYRAVPNGGLSKVATYAREYPNSEATEFTAFLFGAVNKLDRMLCDRASEDLAERTV